MCKKITDQKCYTIKKLEDLIERQKEQYKTAKDELTEKARRDYLEKILPPLPEVLLKLKEALVPNILKALTERNEKKRPQLQETEEKLQREAEYQARCLVETVWLRIFEKTGKLTSCDHVYIRGCELNGYFSGENARRSVHTIYAGGYNIQCLHIFIDDLF